MIKVNFLNNYLWLSIEKVLRIALGFFIFINIAKLLGPTAYGDLSLALAVVGILYPLSSMSMQLLAVREISRFPKRSIQIATSTFFIIITNALLILTLFATIIIFTKIELSTYLGLTIILISLLFRGYDALDWFLLGKGRHHIISKIKILSFLISTSLYILAFNYSTDVIIYAIIYTTEHAIILIITLICIRRSIPLANLLTAPKKITIKYYLKKAYPLAASGLLVVVNMKFDQILVYTMLGQSEAGNYGMAVRLIEVCYLLPLLLTTSLLPLMLQKTSNLNRQMSLYSKMFLTMIIISLIIIITSTVASKSIVLYLGEDYHSVPSIIRLLAYSSIPVLMGSVWSIWIVQNNKSIITVYAQSLAVVLNIVLNFYLIPLHGVIGAAMATLISYSISFTLSLLLYQPKNLLRMLLPITAVNNMFNRY